VAASMMRILVLTESSRWEVSENNGVEGEGNSMGRRERLCVVELYGIPVSCCDLVCNEILRGKPGIKEDPLVSSSSLGHYALSSCTCSLDD